MTNEIRDSFYDDDDNNNNNHSPSLISKIQIVTSKPPVYPQQNQSLNSSYSSEHDITDVSSLNEQQPFRLQSMKHVLLGLSTPNSPPSSPVYFHQQELNKKDVRFLTNDNKKTRLQQHYEQPYIHNHQRFRLTSSAINRQKQQQKIERENLKILERLQHVRSTRSLKREEQLSHYNHQMGLQEPLFHLPSRPTSAANVSSSFSISEKNRRTQSRPSSAAYSINSNTIRSRSVSASHRSSSRKPIWNDRWQQQE